MIINKESWGIKEKEGEVMICSGGNIADTRTPEQIEEDRKVEKAFIEEYKRKNPETFEDDLYLDYIPDLDALEQY